MRVLVGVIGVGGTGAGARAVLAGIVEHHHLVHRHEPFVLDEIGATDRVRRLQRGLTAHDEQRSEERRGGKEGRTRAAESRRSTSATKEARRKSHNSST